MVKKEVSIPKRGDIYWMEFGPVVGHEQDKHRPGLIVSEEAYNRCGLALVVPITSQKKGWQFEVDIISKGKSSISGVALADQVRNIDWEARLDHQAGTASPSTVEEVLAKIQALID